MTNTAPHVFAVISKATPIDLGGGRVFYLRKLNVSLILAKLGTIPQSFLDLAALAGSQVFQKESEAFNREHPDWVRRYSVALLEGAVVALQAQDEDGTPVTNLISLVDKPLGECGPADLPLSYVDDEDQAALLNAIQIDNGLTQEAADARRPFLRGEILAVFLGLDSATVSDRPDGNHGMAH
jgi:hypothetical protein